MSFVFGEDFLFDSFHFHVGLRQKLFQAEIGKRKLMNVQKIYELIIKTFVLKSKIINTEEYPLCWCVYVQIK